MGLDISAYKNLQAVQEPKFDEYGELVNWSTEWQAGDSMKWSEENWPGRGEGINPEQVYTFEKEYSFRAGSYSGYNWWRAKLDEFKGEVAFQELINFADNEGVIGPIVSKKLAIDFAANKEEARKFSKTLGDEGEYWFSRYICWKEAFEYASENGAVDFR